MDFTEIWVTRMATAIFERSETPLRQALAQKVGESRYGIWFGDEVRLDVRGDALEVGVPNVFFKDWIEGHFSQNLVEAALQVTGRKLKLNFKLDAEAPPQLGHVVPADQTPNERPSASPAPASPSTADNPRNRLRQIADTPSLGATFPATSTSPARPHRRLDHFVTGPCNRLAFAAAQEMAVSMGTAFNPLVIHGSVGLGKTHLLEGISAAMRTNRPGMRIMQMTAEGFTNSFLEAMRGGQLNSFRSRYRAAGALIVDDVHFLAAKRATQDEFLHTFNALMAEGVPIIMACDNHPRQISRLTDELATRFLGGMVVRIDTPDPVTRKAILKAKAIARGIDLPDSVLSYIAEHLRASVRELEGALHSLIAHSALTGKRLDLALAKTALRDTIRHTSRAVGLKDVEKSLCSLFNISADDLRAEGRARAISYPRMLAMYLARKHVGASYSEIGKFFGGRNHSTVISAEKTVAQWLADEQRVALLDGFETTREILASLEQTLGA
jgi:chromosomal replication initiator protein